MKSKVLVSGATGNTGGNAVKYLLEKKVPVRAMVHKIDERSERLSAMGAEVIVGDLSDLTSVKDALHGISSAFFVYPIQQPGIIEATAYFGQAALENGVGNIINLSQFGARRHARSIAAQNHWIAERVFDRSGVAVTHVRPTIFAEWFSYQATMIKSQRKFFLPFGEARYAPIATEDIGRVIATLLTAPEPHAGKSYDLFGSQIMDMHQVADIFSEILGSAVTYIPIDTKTFTGIVKQAMNAGPYFLQHVTSLGQDLKDGRAAGMNDLVEKLTGIKPMGMADYILKHKADFI